MSAHQVVRHGDVDSAEVSLNRTTAEMNDVKSVVMRIFREWQMPPVK